MAQPTPYEPAHDFTDFSTDFPTTPHRGDWLDAEYAAIAETCSEILANLELIQRDDGEIANQTVGREQLKTDVVAGINTPAAWAALTEYTVRDSVIFDSSWYWCNTAHTSQSTFAADSGKWTLIFDFAGLALAASIADHSLAYVKIQNVSATDKILGRASSGAGTIEEITCTSAARALLDDTVAGDMLTTLGFSTYGKTLIDDTSAGAAQTTLGISTFMGTVLDDTSAGAARTTLGLGDISTYNVSNVNPATLQVITGTSLILQSNGTANIGGVTSTTIFSEDDVSIFCDDVFIVGCENIIFSGAGGNQTFDIEISGPMGVDLGSISNNATFENHIKEAGSNFATASDFTKTTNTTAANITGLAAGCGASQTYEFEAILYCSPDSTGGVKVGTAYTGTMASIRAQVNALGNTGNAFLSAFDLTATGTTGTATGDTNMVVYMHGTFTTTTAGSFTITFAQASATNSSTVLKGSILKVKPI